jgi:hypothetical protein
MYPNLTPPDGMTYEWKVLEVLGEATLTGGWSDCLLSGWSPVPPSRHPDVAIYASGLRLMERPTEKCENFNAEARKKVEDQLGLLFSGAALASELPPGFSAVTSIDGCTLLTDLPEVRRFLEENENDA